MSLGLPIMDVRSMLDGRESVQSTITTRWAQEGSHPGPSEVVLLVLSSHEDLWTVSVVSAAVAGSSRRTTSSVVTDLARNDEATISETARLLQAQNVAVDVTSLPPMADTLATLLSAYALDRAGDSQFCIEDCGHRYQRDTGPWRDCVRACIL